MLIVFARAVILYVAIIASVRIMGKRQIGELQPSELVITILISEIAAIPINDNGIPLVNSFIPLLVLVSLEIITSCVSIKSRKFRNVMQGNSIIIIKDGVIDQVQIKRLRFSVDDIMEELRKKNVFDINEVQYAIVETDGSISIMFKPNKRPVTSGMLDIKVDDTGIPFIIVDDGNIVESHFKDLNTDKVKVYNLINGNNISLDNILIMTLDKAGNVNIIKKDGRI